MDELQEALKHLTALDAALYGTVPVLGLLLRFGRAYWRWFDEPHSLLGAVILGIGGSGLVLSMNARPWQMIVLQGLSLIVATLIAERVFRTLANTVPWIPKDNEWVKPEQK